MKRTLQMVAVALLALPLVAWGQQKGKVELKVTSEVEMTTTNAQGQKETKRIPASQASVAPGDIVIFTVHYVNNGPQTDANVVINNPVPEHMAYIAGTAEGKGARLEYSADKGKTFGAANKLKVKTKENKERPAAASEYTHIRWVLEKPIPKGGSGTVSFRAKVK